MTVIIIIMIIMMINHYKCHRQYIIMYSINSTLQITVSYFNYIICMFYDMITQHFNSYSKKRKRLALKALNAKFVKYNLGTLPGEYL